MITFTKAHAYGNDFLYVDESQPLPPSLEALALDMCSRHTGIGADGLIVFRRTDVGASMQLFNADGSRSEVSGNGVRGLAALLLNDTPRPDAAITVETAAGPKQLTRTAQAGSRQTFRAAMGLPADLRQVTLEAAGVSVDAVVLTFGNPQCVVIGPLPDGARFEQLGPALERHRIFPNRTNVEFAQVEAPDRVRILIWERGVGPTESSGTGSCASLVAAARFGGAAAAADVVAPGGSQRVEWLADSVYLTGWAEVVCRGEWLRES
jgi:diaminopimelate epimerase